ncbi:uncharacterized protein BDZ99DRAFT_476128 [Mytilinidion resinicola]|uniref:Uncharacterized protein n=1 Tax=Mytilinidion resinicola TaxID=574789 RepID=A0A6A6YLY5_9PEZI|nr:uncharacterized protein BDZ99DRAFT_476128 [Mytilinidion resinicola]KAF2809886.1 hypothetical protein BDZ99DRAFT_476128 [Mytilinidion resinicola]
MWRSVLVRGNRHHKEDFFCLYGGSSKGTVVLSNKSKGNSMRKKPSAPGTSSSLAREDAEWIVEDFEENNAEVPLSDLHTITFTSVVTKAALESVGLSGALGIEMK